MLMELSFYEATIGEKWNVREMGYIKIFFLYLLNRFIISDYTLPI